MAPLGIASSSVIGGGYYDARNEINFSGAGFGGFGFASTSIRRGALVDLFDEELGFPRVFHGCSVAALNSTFPSLRRTLIVLSALSSELNKWNILSTFCWKAHTLP